MIRVHHLNDSRSQRVLWLLEELGLDYEVVRYQRDPKTMLGPAALKAVHPLGKSPVIEDGSIKVAETGAIIDYLLETHGQGRLRPPAGTEAGRRFTYWLHYAEGSAMTPLLLKLIFSRLPANAPGLVRPVVKAVSNKALAVLVDPQLTRHMDYWNDELAATGWFAGEEFSAADIMMSFPLEAAGARAGARSRSRVANFIGRIQARPAYVRALERGGPYSYA